MADPAALERIRVYFERLAREDLARIGEIYTDDARFKDPFNEVASASLPTCSSRYIRLTSS